MENINVPKNNDQFKSDSGVLYHKKNNMLIIYPRKRAGDKYTILAGTKSIGVNAFMGASLKSISIPNSVTSLSENVFKDCTRLTDITFPAGIKKFPAGIFTNCSSLKNVSLPPALTTLGDHAFWNCSSLVDISIPKNVTQIGYSIFYGCKSLKAIHVAKGNKNYADYDGILYSISSYYKSLICFPAAKITKNNTYTVKKGVSRVANYAFAHSTLKEIDLPESVSYIDIGAFSNCNNLTSVIMRNKSITINDTSESYETINPYLLTDTSKLVISGYYFNHDFDSPERSTYRYGIKFRQLDKATEGLIINDNGEIVGYTGNETVITIPCIIKTANNKYVSVTSIGKDAFKNPYNKDSMVYEQITAINIPYSINTIKDSAFEGCKSLTSKGLTLEYLDNISKISASAFKNCSSLTSIVIPEHVSDIDTSAFDGCTSLTEINVSYYRSNFQSMNGILVYRENKKHKIYKVPMSFSGDNGSYVIPESINYLNFGLEYVTSIKENAFTGCFNITSVTLPESVAKIEKNVFFNCENLTDIYVFSKNLDYPTEGEIFSSDMIKKSNIKLHGFSGSSTEVYATEKNITFIPFYS